MKKFPSKNIGDLEVVAITISIIILVTIVFHEIACSYFFQRFSTSSSIITGILTGLISAIALLFFQEKHYQYKLTEYYGEIAGEYERIDINQDNLTRKEGEDERPDIFKDNVKLPIILEYQPEHSFRVNAEYWKSKEGFVEATIEFNEKSGMQAIGRYRYTRGTDLKGDSGIYKIYRLEEDNTKLLVLYEMLFPRKPNFDKNKGWEIWQKK